MQNRIKTFIGLIIGLMVILFVVNMVNQGKVDTVKDCRVEKLVQQNIISGNQTSLVTEIRYLVITDKETFICQSSVINGKFNNSDIFWHLEEGKTYSFKVSGMGKSFITDYRNILEQIN